MRRKNEEEVRVVRVTRKLKRKGLWRSFRMRGEFWKKITILSKGDKKITMGKG